ncbi:unnamed protein product [Symbiodinium sp. CCMP2592]|nr:unnamed protein product [Symbiodinium sp. CCMP2592]
MSSDGRLTAGSTSSSNSSSSSDSSAAPDSCDESSEVSEVSLAAHDDVFAAEQSSSEEADGPVDHKSSRLAKKLEGALFSEKLVAVSGRVVCVRYAGSTVHFWTFPHSNKPDAITATDHGKKCLGKALKQVYGADSIAYYCVVAEQHASSSRRWERTWHWHAVLKLSRRVKWKAVAKNLRERGFYGRLALPQFHADIWRILRYVLCPSFKKSHSELDGDPYFSSTFPLEQMESKMRKYSSASFRPSDMFNALRNLRPRLTSYQELIEWAEQQRQRGNGKFQEFMARQGPKMQPLFLSWQMMLTETTTPKQREERLRLWAAASQEACVCYEPSRLREALDNLLEHHGKSIDSELVDFEEALARTCPLESSEAVGRKRKAEHPLASTPSEAAPPVASEPAVHAARPPSLPHSWSAEFGEHPTSTLAQPWTPPGSPAEASFGESWPAWTPPRTAAPLEHLDEELAQPWTPLGPPPTSPENSRLLSPHWETPPEIHAAFRSQSAQAVSSSQSDALSSPVWRTPPEILEAFRQGL